MVPFVESSDERENDQGYQGEPKRPPGRRPAHGCEGDAEKDTAQGEINTVSQFVEVGDLDGRELSGRLTGEITEESDPEPECDPP